MKKIDKVDVKILKELLEDSNQALSKVGKAVRLSRENVYYHIQKLLKKKVIRNFVTNISAKKLGHSKYVMFLGFERIRKEEEEKVLSFLKKNKHISWIGILSGKWSLTLDIYVKNIDELDKIVSEILDKFSSKVGDYIVLQLSDSEYFFNKLINASINLPKKDSEITKNIDKTDIKILKQLNDDSRKSYVEIANTLHISPNTAKNRIKNLEKRSYIEGYSLSIDHKYFGYEWHGLQIKLEKSTSEIENKVISFLRNHPKIIFFYKYVKSGLYDFDIGVIVKDTSELRDFINEIRSKFYGEIKIYDTFVVLEEASSHNLPPAVFEI